MARRKRRKPAPRPQGYPAYAAIKRGIAIRVQRKRPPIYQTCETQLTVTRSWEKAALLQTFKNATLAAQRILALCKAHHPYNRFKSFYMFKTKHVDTNGIRAMLEKQYESVMAQYELSSSVRNNLWEQLAWMIGSWLALTCEGKRRGYERRYLRAVNVVVPFGKHQGKRLGDLPRDTLRGYESLATRQQCVETLDTLRQFQAALEASQDGTTIFDAVCLTITHYDGTKLGDLLPNERAFVEQLIHNDLKRIDDLDRVRNAATSILDWSPPGFPTIHSDGLSPKRRRTMTETHMQALDEYATTIETLDLAFSEHRLFQVTQRAIAADTASPRMVPLLFTRADAFGRQRDLGIGFDAKQKRFYALIYLLAASSRHKSPITLPDDVQITDANNPTITFTPSKRANQSLLFPLQFGTHQHRLLLAAQQNAYAWKRRYKAKPTMTAEEIEALLTSYQGGCMRSGMLSADYDAEMRRWQFILRIAVGTYPEPTITPTHLLALHSDPETMIYGIVTTLHGKEVAHYVFDEATITYLLKNPVAEENKTNADRTTKEYQHRLADAICVVAMRHRAIVLMESIAYRRQARHHVSQSFRTGVECHQTLVTLLTYKLPLQRSLPPILMYGIAPTRDCGQCGHRYPKSPIVSNVFTCVHCGFREAQWFNTCREIVRRGMWRLAETPPPKK